MKISLFCLGRMKEGALSDIFALYTKRLKSGSKLGPITCRELDVKAAKTAQQTIAKEAQALHDVLPPKDGQRKFIILDETGRNMKSQDFAARLQSWQDEGTRELVVVIGGAYGLHDDIRNLGDIILALGSMTWPHQMVRCMIAEQFYRADAILSGHPYHKE